jgi:hypothetical protein
VINKVPRDFSAFIAAEKSYSITNRETIILIFKGVENLDLLHATLTSITEVSVQ